MERIKKVDSVNLAGSVEDCLSELDSLRRRIILPSRFPDKPETNELARVSGVMYVYNGSEWETM